MSDQRYVYSGLDDVQKIIEFAGTDQLTVNLLEVVTIFTGPRVVNSPETLILRPGDILVRHDKSGTLEVVQSDDSVT